MTENKKQQMEAARAKIKQMNVDKAVLRYLIIDSELVHSTAADDKIGCKYIYVKPGMYDDIVDISNIDFVQKVYAENGIELKKHVSHLDRKEVEVLYITASDIATKLNKMQQKFLSDTAPDYHSRSNVDYRQRTTDIVNKVYHSQRINKK